MRLRGLSQAKSSWFYCLSLCLPYIIIEIEDDHDSQSEYTTSSLPTKSGEADKSLDKPGSSTVSSKEPRSADSSNVSGVVCGEARESLLSATSQSVRNDKSDDCCTDLLAIQGSDDVTAIGLDFPNIMDSSVNKAVQSSNGDGDAVEVQSLPAVESDQQRRAVPAEPSQSLSNCTEAVCISDEHLGSLSADKTDTCSQSPVSDSNSIHTALINSRRSIRKDRSDQTMTAVSASVEGDYASETHENEHSTQSLEEALKVAAASIERQVEETKERLRKEEREKRRQKRAALRQVTTKLDECQSQEEVVEEELAEHEDNPSVILVEALDSGSRSDARKSRRKTGCAVQRRSPRSKTDAAQDAANVETDSQTVSQPLRKRVKLSAKPAAHSRSGPRLRSKAKKASPKSNAGSSNKSPLRVQLHGRLLSKSNDGSIAGGADKLQQPVRRNESDSEAVSRRVVPNSCSMAAGPSKTPPATPKILTAKLPEPRCSAEPNPLSVAAIPGMYVIRKRGSWLICGVCRFRSKHAADLSQHLRQFDFYGPTCPNCGSVVTRSHRGPDNKILNCLLCGYRNGDHIAEHSQVSTQDISEEMTGPASEAAVDADNRFATVSSSKHPTPKEDIMAIATRTIMDDYVDDDDEMGGRGPSIISEITDESGQPVRVLSVERDLDELVRAGVVTVIARDVDRGIAQVSINAEMTDVIQTDEAQVCETGIIVHEGQVDPCVVTSVLGSQMLANEEDSGQQFSIAEPPRHTAKSPNLSPKKVPAILRRRKQTLKRHVLT